jgi:homoserine acetyltransferase
MLATRYPQPSHEVALSSHSCVCSSVQLGTAKRVGAATPLLGRKIMFGLEAAFPRYCYADIVEAQHRFVTEGLGLARLRLVP